MSAATGAAVAVTGAEPVSPLTCELVAQLLEHDPLGRTIKGLDHRPDSCQVIESLPPGPVRLAMSRGKDSLVAWLHLLSHGRAVEPVFFRLVPGLAFETADLARLSEHFGAHITELPHPSLLRMLRTGLFQPPKRHVLLAQSDIGTATFETFWRLLDDERGSAPVCHGVRASDSPIRRTRVVQSGPVTKSGAWVVWDWRKSWWVEALRLDDLALPVDYQWFGRSFDGLDARFLGPLRQHAPADYATVLEWFPLAWLGLEPRAAA